MNTITALSILIGALVFLILYLIFVPRTSSPPVRESSGNDNVLFKIANLLESEFYGALPEGTRIRERSRHPKLEQIIRQSGNPWGVNEDEFIAISIFATIGGFIAGWGIWWFVGYFNPLPWWVVVPISTGLLGALPFLKYRELAQDRDLAFKKQLPQALDLIVISLAGGKTFEGALRESIPNMEDGVLKDEFEELLLAVELGKPLDTALGEFKERAPNEGVRVFVQAVQEATALDVSLTDVLRSRAAASRQELFALIHEKVSALPTKLMTVLTPTLSGALLIILMAPALITITRIL